MEARLLTKLEAAEYCKLKLAGFDDWRNRGLLPGPVAGTRRWDRHVLDKALDRLSGIEAQSETTPYDKWKQNAQA